MARKTVLLDDFDGNELPDDISPIKLTVQDTTYALYLSEKNYAKLVEALEPFTKGADKVSTRTVGSRSTGRSTASADKDRMKRIREWAQETGYRFERSDGERVTLGDRGRIPQQVIKAYSEANLDD